MSYTTVSKVIKGYRVTIPIEIREVAGIKIGDDVQITIEKIKEPYMQVRNMPGCIKRVQGESI